MGSRGRFSGSRLSTRTTCAATPTRTTLRCGARLSLSGSANVERSRWPTVRIALPTTESKSHQATTPHGLNAISLQSHPAFSHAIPGELRSTTPQKPHDFNVSISKSEMLAGELHASFPELHPIRNIAPDEEHCTRSERVDRD